MDVPYCIKQLIKDKQLMSKLGNYHYFKEQKQSIDKFKREEMKRDNAIAKGYSYYINHEGQKVFI